MIVIAGEALVDLVIDPDGQVTAALGGAPFNTARACGRLGEDVAFVGTISEDRFGTMLAARLAADGVSTEHIVRIDLPTTLAAAELDERGAASYRFYIQGTSAPALSSVPPDLDFDALFVGGLGLVLEPMAETIETLVAETHADDRDQLVMVDINCRPLIVPNQTSYSERVGRILRGAHIVKVSDEDLAYLSPGVEPLVAGRRLLRSGPLAVLLTAGGAGVHVLTAQGEAVVPVEPVEVVDTIGAGDSFGGGFLSWWMKAGNTPANVADVDRLVGAVRAANTVAGVVCTRVGADPPWIGELRADWAP